MSRPAVNKDFGRFLRSDGTFYNALRQFIVERISERQEAFEASARGGILNPSQRLQSAAVTLGQLTELENLLQDVDSLVKEQNNG